MQTINRFFLKSSIILYCSLISLHAQENPLVHFDQNPVYLSKGSQTVHFSSKMQTSVYFSSALDYHLLVKVSCKNGLLNLKNHEDQRFIHGSGTKDSLIVLSGISVGELNRLFNGAEFIPDSSNIHDAGILFELSSFSGHSNAALEINRGIKPLNFRGDTALYDFFVEEDQSLNIPVYKHLSATEKPDSALTAIIKRLPESGQLKAVNPKLQVNDTIPASSYNLTYKPVHDFNGTDTLCIDVKNDSSEIIKMLVYAFHITPVNDPPSTASMNFTFPEDSVLLLEYDDFDHVFYDPDDDPLSGIIIHPKDFPGIITLNHKQLVASGLYPLAENDQIRFFPGKNLNGTFSIEFNLSDGYLPSRETSTIQFNIKPVNDLPVIENIFLVSKEDEPVIFEPVHFLASYQDADTNQLKEIILKDIPPASLGKIVLNDSIIRSPGTVAFKDLKNLRFKSHFKDTMCSIPYSMSDGQTMAEEDKLIYLATFDVNDPPIVKDILKQGKEDRDIYFNPEMFLKAYSDPDNDKLLKIRFSGLSAGGYLFYHDKPLREGEAVDVYDALNLVYAPPQDFSGVIEIMWEGSDGSEFSDESAFLTFQIENENDPPFLVDLEMKCNTKDGIKFSKEDFLLAFSDVDNDRPKDFIIKELPAHGHLLLENKKIRKSSVIPIKKLDELIFIPEENFSGDDAFSWNISDGERYSDIDAHTSIFIEESREMIEPLRGFSPDNDGFNDKWLIRNIDHYPSNKVSIFTPEGEEVCVIKGYDNKTRYWDGSVSSTIRKAKKNTYSGKYSYIIDLGNGSDTIKGFVVINQ